MKIGFARRAGALLLAIGLALSLAPAALASSGNIQSLVLSSDKTSLQIGETAILTARFKFADPAQDNVELGWSVSPAGILEISHDMVGGSGKEELTNTITAIGAGEATITVECSGVENSCKVTVAAVPVTSVTLSDQALDLTAGESRGLTADIRPENATDKAVTWNSDRPSVATVDNNGKVTAVGVGTANITAKAGAVTSAPCVVTVAAAPVTVHVSGVGIQGEKTRTVEVGGTLELTALVEPANATNKAVTWHSADTDIATVDGSGKVTGVAAGGPVDITVTTEDGALTATVKVSVTAPVTTVLVTPSRGANPINVNGSLTLSADTDKAVTWSSDKTAVATVDSGGKVTGVSPGTATITAVTSDGKTGTYIVTVSGLVMNKSTLNLVVNYSETLTYESYGAAATDTASAKWAANPESIATVSSSGRVTGLDPGVTTITVSKAGYSAECKVTVVEDVADAINRSLNAGQKLDFSGLLSDLNSRCREKTKASLDYITNLQVATRQGILHYRYDSQDTPNHGVGGVERYYYSAPSGSGKQAISDLSFVPSGSFSGTAEIEYTGYSTEGTAFHGTIRVTVQSAGDVMVSTAKNRPLTLEPKVFRDICQIKTGRSASYVTFSQPSSGRGTLYYNYSPTGQWSQKVDSGTRYYMGSDPSVEKVTFVPAENFTGSVTVSYRCTDTTGGSYQGTMTITVYATEGGGSSGGVEYTTGIGQRVTLNAADFNDACEDANDRSLSYLYFDSLPNASQGVLYYNYTSSSSGRVDTATRYNRSNTGNRISYITFVPASNFSGDVTVPYTGYDTAGQTYRDNLVIHVTDAAGVVYYTTGEGQALTFRAEDFNDACQRANGSTLNYIYFDELPSSRAGTLYQGYRSENRPGTKVSTSQRYTRGGNPSVSDVTFVPRSSYAGTVSIPFNGYDASGARFEGSVNITVGQVSGRVVSYATASGGVVRFDAADFNTVCRTVTGDNLDYVSFDPPASRYGTLYYQYNAGRDTGTRVSSAYNYYRSGNSRLLNDISFAAANTNGTASFTYDARSTGGERFTGTVEIAIGTAGSTGGVAAGGTNYIGSANPITLRAADFESVCRGETGGSLSHIRFTGLPDESTGRLYMSYASPGKPGAPATTTANYTASGGLAIGQLSFVPRAGYQGQVSIPYTGYDTQGATFTGTVRIDISPSYCATPFYDVDTGWDWAKPSVEFLRSAGITNGYSDNTFRPSRSISRGEFVLMICRAFGFDTSSRVSSFRDVPADSVYAGAVATARSMGIVEGSNGRFNPNSPITRQGAMTMLCRAMRAAGKKVPAASGSALNVYSDHAQVAAYARESMASLVRMGVVQGGSDMRLNPTRSISRAQMAAILHRALTM